MREAFCLEDGKYTDNKDINKYLLNPAVKGVTKTSNIKIPEVLKKKEGRKVVAVKLKLEENVQQFLSARCSEDATPALNLSDPLVKTIHDEF